MFDQKQRFIIRDYQSKPPFSSFLPGIAGPRGIPVWCYYNNRGQAVCSFGVQDKDHAIMEFCPAHIAYRDVSCVGFRTFCKVNGSCRELFTENCDMYIGMSEVEISCRNGELEASAVCFGVPGERIGALARELTVKNAGKEPVELELLDGMPALVPYGVNQDALKNMTQLAKAWMQAENVEEGRAYFRVRASMEDTACVTQVEGGNFCLAWDEAGNRLVPLVEPALIFGEDTSFSAPVNFRETSLDSLCARGQVTQNIFPCCFLPKKIFLGPGEAARIFSLYGQSENKERVGTLAGKVKEVSWFEEKRGEARMLTEDLCAAVETRTADPVFDAYCRQTYLDNLLRGGTPMFFEHGGKSTPFYLYSRKHGDPEREYNYFSLGREYYAQGNGNFRDVNQNRRCDVLFAPRLGTENIHTFFDLLQTDGYNPLVIMPDTYCLTEEKRVGLLAEFGGPAAVEGLLSRPFTPGKLAMELEDLGVGPEEAQAFTAAAVCAADREPDAVFSEGYWCDHWTYNLDLIESYLAVFPEKKDELLFDDCSYRYYETRLKVNPRTKRYCRTEKGLRQYNALDEQAKKGISHKWMHTAQGEEARSTLAEKLLLLCGIKTATLDPSGMGVEMEGGKPGWYDALNGLPGLMGSSMAESCELARLLRFTIRALEQREEKATRAAGKLEPGEEKVTRAAGKLEPGEEKATRAAGKLEPGEEKATRAAGKLEPGEEKVTRAADKLELYEEIAGLLCSVDEILRREAEPYRRWDRLNQVKEDYRERTLWGYTGRRVSLTCADLAEMLGRMEKAVLRGIEKAVEIGGGICPTYFTFRITADTELADGPMPTALEPEPLPLFLEGPVRWMKLEAPEKEKRNVAELVRRSGLYDGKLHMYKVNASLKDVSYEAGRAKAFTPGWLENESIWLHMEYKYLLELLKSGLYDLFGEAFREAAVPFLDPEIYGRSPLENVSFLASSVNPDPSVHGRGFVARLSGSTAEFLQMWQLMFFGPKPFRVEDGELRMELAPCIPGYLMPENKTVEAAFLGHIRVTYRASGCEELRPGQTIPDRYLLCYEDGREQTVDGRFLEEPEAKAVRRGLVKAMTVTVKPLG